MTENDNISNPIEWIEDGISKKHIKYYEYEHFSNIEKIGNGGFGTVYRAKWKNMEQYLVLKSFKEYNEAKIVRELTLQREVDFHINIIRFLGITSSSKYNINNSLEHYLLVMEYADGGTLGEYLMKNSDSLSWDDRFNIAYQLTCAVSCLHDERIIHGDLHSSNILIHQNIVKLADFGLSQRIEEVTTSGLIGAIAYIDPKKIKEKEYKLNKMSDVYSVGVLLWEISSGQLPFKGCDDCSLMVEIPQGLRETPVSNTPTDYVNLYTECWNGEPDKRPVMSEVVDRMKKILFINDNTEIGYSNQIVTNSLSNAIIARSQFSSDGLDKLVTNEVKLAIANLITLSQTEANVFSSERLNNLVTNEIKLAIDGIVNFIYVEQNEKNGLKKKNNRSPIHLAIKAKTTHFKNKNEWNEWIEEAITKEYLKYYEYKNFNDVEEISSFDEVYRARWKNLDNYLTLKSSGYNLERFVHELKIQRVAAFHDNIIKFYGITVLEEGDKTKKYLLVREYADGGSLRNYLKENFNSLTWKNKIDLAYQLACAVSFLHVEGIIHRNLESRIILIHQHTIKLAGFGYSNWIENISATVEIPCIPYADPKKFSLEYYSFNKMSDIYSIGVLLWEISSGRPPFEGWVHYSLMVRIPKGLRETPIPNTPTDYVNLYTECWNGEPDYRPPISEVVNRLKILQSSYMPKACF